MLVHCYGWVRHNGVITGVTERLGNSACMQKTALSLPLLSLHTLHHNPTRTNFCHPPMRRMLLQPIRQS